MITAERLKELIEKESTIYSVQNNKIFEIELKEGFFEDDDTSTICKFSVFDECLELNNDNGENEYAWLIEDLFETKSEAEFYAKYGDVEITVKAPNLLSWNELKKYKQHNDYYSIRWCKNMFEIDIQYLFCVNLKGEFISLRREVDGNINKYLIDEKLTEQSYIEALDKMVELWREEV